MATPSKNRHGGIPVGLPGLPGCHAAPAPTAVVEIPPSSISRISDSTSKARDPSLGTDRSQQRYEAGFLTNAQTPTRGPLKVLGRPPEPGTSFVTAIDPPPPVSSVANWKPLKAVFHVSSMHPSSVGPANIQDTPPKARKVHRADAHEDNTVHETPKKTIATTNDSMKSFQVTAPPSPDQREQSIYASLGWDDVDDLA